uniref:Cytochrome P450 monooxygeanse terK n=1 Tax=Tolypocladium album TaxID=124418 RepID=TERK_TOLAL|nr:cytochrome P450 monooxygenase [Tolypocladium album]
MNDYNVTGTTLGDAFAKLPPNWGQLTGALLFLAACTWIYLPAFDGVPAPFAGYRSPLEPAIVAKTRYAFAASDIISEGYAKWKSSMYKISRHGGDVVVLSRKYIDELQNAPHERLSSIKGLIKNFGGQYSGIDLLDESDIGTRALQTKITPNLTKFSDDMRDELEYALGRDMPDCEDWTLVPLQPILLKLLGRITSRVLIGLPICRDEKWLDAASQHAHNVTITQIVMKAVHPIFRPFLNLVLPTVWRYKSAVRRGKAILAPEVQRRRNLEDNDPDYVKPNDLLQAMMDLSTPGGKDSQPEDLAHRHLLITLVAGHSTAAAGSHALMDLVSRPQLLEELRDEVLQVLQENGGNWGKQSLSKLWKMDSFFRESQRQNPPSLLGFHRIVQDPAGITLHDGVHVPYGTHLCIAPHSVSSDPAVIPNPDVFDGLRYYEQRRQKPDESMKHQHATADKNHLHFGYGTWSCPGRFLASDELKMTLSALLLRYDFKYPDGSSRPTNKHIDEFPYVDPETPLLMRRRHQGGTGV